MSLLQCKINDIANPTLDLKQGIREFQPPEMVSKLIFFRNLLQQTWDLYQSAEEQGVSTKKLPIRVWAISQTIVIFRNTEVQMSGKQKSSF